jgi:hypothetical protein
MGGPITGAGSMFIIRDHLVGSTGEIEALADQIREELQKALPDGQVKVDVQIRRV